MRSFEAAVRTILLKHWDPIGVSFIAGAADEYDTQVMAIVGWLHRKRPGFSDLRKYLDDEAYELSPTWDDDAALDETTRLLLSLKPE